MNPIISKKMNLKGDLKRFNGGLYVKSFVRALKQLLQSQLPNKNRKKLGDFPLADFYYAIKSRKFFANLFSYNDSSFLVYSPNASFLFIYRIAPPIFDEEIIF